MRAYFNKMNIEKISRGMLSRIRASVKTRKLKLQKERIALLIMDMQKNFLDKDSKSFIPAGRAIEDNLRKLVDLFQKRGLPIVFTKQISDNNNCNLMNKWWGTSIPRGSEKAQLKDEYNISRDTYIIEKRQYDAFYKTNLEKILKKKKIKQLVITGVSANICCQATSLAAFARGIEVIIPVDAIATVSKYYHESAVHNLATSCVHPILTKDLIKELAKK